jgi:hypothetical protein
MRLTAEDTTQRIAAIGIIGVVDDTRRMPADRFGRHLQPD